MKSTSSFEKVLHDLHVMVVWMILAFCIFILMVLMSQWDRLAQGIVGIGLFVGGTFCLFLMGLVIFQISKNISVIEENSLKNKQFMELLDGVVIDNMAVLEVYMSFNGVTTESLQQAKIFVDRALVAVGQSGTPEDKRKDNVLYDSQLFSRLHHLDELVRQKPTQVSLERVLARSRDVMTYALRLGIKA